MMRSGLRLLVAGAIVLAHGWVARTLAAADPVALATERRWIVLAELAGALAALRVVVWFVVPPWLASAALLDLYSRANRKPRSDARSAELRAAASTRSSTTAPASR